MENSPVTEYAYGAESTEEGIFSLSTTTRYNAAGQPLTSSQKQLVSQLSPTLESKVVSVSERGLTSTQWSVYNTDTKRIRYSSVPTPDITAETVTVSGFAVSQKDTAGIETTTARRYMAMGMELVHTDGRGNTTTTVTDIAGRSIRVTDADGNQTLGIWAISYDAENRPTDFTSQAVDGTITTVHCEYDYMGRRATKQVTTNGNITLHQRYIYRGYLQIAALDLTRAAHPALWLITWDPTQPVATRPLAIQKDGTWYTYGWDLTKNICEVYGQHGYIRTAYTYTPYGEVTSAGDVTQPIQWSSEFNDTETALVYYNYRHYNPVDGRWTGRDVVGETIEKNVYIYINKNITSSVDIIGLAGVAKFAHWVTWKLETFGKDIHGANIERIAKYASEITDAHVYEIAQTIHVVTNTARPIRGNQIRYFVFASCECDDGCQLLNNLGATFSIKVEHFVVKPSKLGVGGDDGNRGFSAYLPVPTDNYDEYVQKMTKNKITKLNKWCMDFCGKVEN